MELIYDVGSENGDDSAYYLCKGYKVVGIEASPLAVEKLQRRFAAEIAEGRYVLLPVGIAEKSGRAAFWICDDHAPWSSFDRAIASRNGSRHHSVTVQTRPFRSILEEFGAAIYCKIDIEGSDNLCVEDFTSRTRPQYVSIEVIRGDEQLRLLRRKGYTKFKIISQRSFRQPATALLRLKSSLPRIARLPVTAVEARLLRYRPDEMSRCRLGSSGPFGEATEGEWRTFDEALKIWEAVCGLGDDLNDWHDIHASLGRT